MRPADARIGIIGAGPGGVTLAHLLVQRGFRKITLIERSDRVGGKARTMRANGRAYNAGALYTTLGYGPVNGWLKRFGITKKRVDKATLIFRSGQRVDFLQMIVADFGLPAALLQILRYMLHWLVYYFQVNLRRQTPAGYLKELATPAAAWFAQRRLPFLHRTCLRAYHGMGYGMLATTPMLHVFRWVTPTLLISGVLNLLWEVEHFQTLFERMAEQVRVRPGSMVAAIRRLHDGTFEVKVSGETLTFDRLVVAGYLDEMPDDILAISPRVGEIIPHVRYKRWVVSLCRITRADQTCFYEERVVACPDAWQPTQSGEVLAIKKDIFGDRRESAQDDQYICYQYYNDATEYTPEQSEALLREELRARGGVLVEVLDRFITRYSPTYSAESIEQGVVEKLRAIQGVQGIYFTGATFSHEAVRDIANFNRALADQIVCDLSGQGSTLTYRMRQLLNRLHPFNL